MIWIWMFRGGYFSHRIHINLLNLDNFFSQSRGQYTIMQKEERIDNHLRFIETAYDEFVAWNAIAPLESAMQSMHFEMAAANAAEVDRLEAQLRALLAQRDYAAPLAEQRLMEFEDKVWPGDAGGDPIGPREGAF